MKNDNGKFNKNYNENVIKSKNINEYKQNLEKIKKFDLQ